MSKKMEKLRFELRVKKFLEKKGFFVARQFNTHFPDLVGFNKTDKILVECLLSKRVNKNDVLMLQVLANTFDVAILLAFRQGNKIFFKNVGSKEINL